jgi:hypothetical protein
LIQRQLLQQHRQFQLSSLVPLHHHQQQLPCRQAPFP